MEYIISLRHFLRCAEMLIQQSFEVFLRMAVHIPLLPSVVGIGWRNVEIICQPNPESGAGQKTHSKVQRLFIVHQLFIERKILPHSRSLLNKRLTLWSIFSQFRTNLKRLKSLLLFILTSKKYSLSIKLPKPL